MGFPAHNQTLCFKSRGNRDHKSGLPRFPNGGFGSIFLANFPMAFFQYGPGNEGPGSHGLGTRKGQMGKRTQIQDLSRWGEWKTRRELFPSETKKRASPEWNMPY